MASRCSGSQASGQVTDGGESATGYRYGSAASFNDSQNTGDTSRTSLGRSVRGEFQSYSEKFLAQQEEGKRQYLLAIAEGKPLPPDSYYAQSAGGQLLLTDGSAGSVGTGSRVSGTADPSAQGSVEGSSASASAYDETALTATEYTGYAGTQCTGASGTARSGGAASSKGAGRSGRAQEEFQRSDRKGVYGGGVRYFTPDNGRDDDSEEESAEDDDFEEEEETYEEEEETYEEEEETYREEEETYREESTYRTAEESTLRTDRDESAYEGTYDDVTDVSGSDMGSMFGDEESSYGRRSAHRRGAGVESVTSRELRRDRHGS